MTTQPAVPPSGRGFPLGKLVVGVLAGFALTLAFGAGALLAYQGQYADLIYPGVTVDGVDVSGLTQEAAAARLDDALAGYSTGEAVLAVDGQEVHIPYAALGRRADVDALVALAWSVGRDGADPVARATAGVRSLLDGTAIAPLVVVDQAAVESELTTVAIAANQAPVSATATVTETGFTANPAAEGHAFALASVAAQLRSVLADPAAPSELRLTADTVPVEPYVSDAEVADAVAAAGKMTADVVLAHAKETWTVQAPTVRSWITFETTTDGYRATVEPDAPTKTLTALAKKINKVAHDATFVFQGGSTLGVRAAAEGRTLNVAVSAPLVAKAVVDRAAGGAAAEPVALAITVVQPKLSTEAARKLAPKMRKISTWTTFYEVSERNGFSNNISIPARDLDGVVVAPGAVFDFWKRIGPVTAARGYRYGGAIINGRSQPTGAFAGGICSTSTTLFNAVVRAGYQIRTRHNHAYYITRYPIGLDATVAIENGSVTTMSWKNDSEYPVLIRSSARPGVVSFSLYTVAVNNSPVVGGGSAIPGATNRTYRVANGRTVTFATSAKRNYDRAHASVQRTTALPPGKVQVVECCSVDGFGVTVTRSVSEHGKRIHFDTWVSNYKRVDALTLIGRARS